MEVLISCLLKSLTSFIRAYVYCWYIYARLKIKLFVFVFCKQTTMAPLERGCNPVLCYRKCWPNFLFEATFNKANFWLIFFSFLWHKIIVLISNIFIYAKVGNSKFVEMHGTLSGIYPSSLVFYTQHRVNITVILTLINVCVQHQLLT